MMVAAESITPSRCCRVDKRRNHQPRIFSFPPPAVNRQPVRDLLHCADAADRRLALNRITCALNIVAAVVGVVLAPLAPFAFLIVDGAGRVPGWFHEYAVMALLASYPFALAVGIGGSVFALRRAEPRLAVGVAALPLICALLLAWAFVAGGVRLR